jgi:hypothetical protein
VNVAVTVTAAAGNGSRVRLSTTRANGDGVFVTTFVVPKVAGGLRGVTTDNAAASGTPRAQVPLQTVRTPHGSTK